MKKVIALTLGVLCGVGVAAASEHDRSSVVSWRGIAGVITAPGVDNPVAVVLDSQGNVVSQIHSGTLPWVTRSGEASVDLETGAVRFTVSGLVFVGGNATGTAGPVNQVVGTLVCNPGSSIANQPQAVIDTPPVALSAAGNAQFAGELTQPVPSGCGNPLFLIRLGPAFGSFAGRWLAAGISPRPGGESGGDRGSDRR